MRLTVNYVTHYRYSDPVSRVLQLLRLTPLSFAGHSVLDWRIDVDCDARLRQALDGYGNIIHMLYVDHPGSELKITASGTVLTADSAGVVQGLPRDLPPQIFLRETPLTTASTRLRQLALKIDDEGDNALDKLHRLARAVHARMTFDTASTRIDTVGADAFEAGQGVCQDFTHIFIAVARLMGVPARYVSGHLFRRDGAPVQEAAHAWAEAWVEDLGWVGFDSTNGISTDDAYVRIACGLDYRDAAPITGSRSGGGRESLHVAVQVSEGQRQSQFQSQS